MRSPAAYAQCFIASRAVDKTLGTSVEQRRHAAARLAHIALDTDADGITVTRHEVPIDGGEIAVYVYRPRASGPVPALVYFHGGGYWSGQAAHVDHLAREYVRVVGCVVVNVEYRLAPEHPFPAAPNDAYAALLWTVTHAAELGVDVSRIAVGGVSVGGGLAAAMPLMSRDLGGPTIAAQVIETPVVDSTSSFPSARRNQRSSVNTRNSWKECVTFYLPNVADRRHPYASPIFEPDLTGLPPAVVLVAQYDMLRDEAYAYVRRLKAANVPTELIVARNHAHATVHGGGRFFRTAGAYRAETQAALRRVLTTGS